MEATKEKLNSRSLLRWLQSLGLTYGEASALLHKALEDLQTLRGWEMDHLPLPLINEGLHDNLDAEKIILSSTGKPYDFEKRKKKEGIYFTISKYHSEDSG